jgi:spore maturation protein CgeB
MNDYWAKNIDILTAQDPELAHRLEREWTSSEVEKITAPSGDITVRVNGITLHSRYHPRAEARNQVADFLNRHQSDLEPAKTGTPVPIVVVGVGMGYHVDELLSQLADAGLPPERAPLVVVEPNYSVLRAALESRDLTEILSHAKILAGLHPDLNAVLATKSHRNSPIIYIHPPYRKLHPDTCQKVELQCAGVTNHPSSATSLKILAITPIYGGSLPTLHYSVDALKDCGHRVEILDNTPYYDILMGIENLTRDRNHRNSLQALLTTFLAECAVARAIDVKADMVFAVAQSPMVPASIQELHRLKIPIAFWFVEDRYLFPYWKEYAPLYDHFFVIQPGEFLDELKAMGVKNAHYLPCAAHPPQHRPIDLTPQEHETYGSDISFMGAGYYNRHQMFLKLLDFDFKIWGQEWNLASPLGKIIQRNGQRISPQEYIKIFAASKINLNLHSSPAHEGVNPHGDFVNPRAFELAACRAFQLVDHRSALPDLFEIGNEMVTFRDANDLRQKIRHYLDHPDERQTIAGRAHKRVLAEHTYRHRMETMMSKVLEKEPVLYSAKPAPDSPKALIQQAGPDSELGTFLAKFANEEEVTLDRIAQEIRKGKGELSRTEGIFLLMKEFQDWGREKGVINT